MMEVIKITPRGYCYGVVDAMVIARNAALDPSLPRPIYILGMIVHNKHVTDAFAEEGIITLDGENRLEILEKTRPGHRHFHRPRRLTGSKKPSARKGTCHD